MCHSLSKDGYIAAPARRLYRIEQLFLVGRSVGYIGLPLVIVLFTFATVARFLNPCTLSVTWSPHSGYTLARGRIETEMI